MTYLTDYSAAELVSMYNGFATKLARPTVNRFSDRKTAERRVAAIRADHDTQFDLVATDPHAEAAAATEAAKDAVLSNRNAGREETATEAKLDAAVKAPKPAKAPKSAALKSGKIVLKANKEVRAQLTAACQQIGGTRLEPVGFDSYTAFLGGFDLNAERGGDTLIQFFAVKGKERVSGSVMLEVRGSDRRMTVRSSSKVAPFFTGPEGEVC